MTTHEILASESARPRTLQDDLLDDLRQTAPMPDPRPGTQRPRAKRPPIEASTTQPAVELRVTRNPWRSPSMRLASKGLIVSAGPISVSVGLSRR